MFLLVYVFSALAVFCGPIMTLASSWNGHVPGGNTSLLSVTIGAGVIIFTTVEGLSQSEALYASIITGEWNACSSRVYCKLFFKGVLQTMTKAKDLPVVGFYFFPSLL
jgi:hypothetical protein